MIKDVQQTDSGMKSTLKNLRAGRNGRGVVLEANLTSRVQVGMIGNQNKLYSKYLWCESNCVSWRKKAIGMTTRRPPIEFATLES